MDQVVIVAGGNRDIEQYRKLMSSANPGTTKIIGVDSGALWLVDHGENVDVAVGDFDTIGENGVQRLKNANIKLIQAQPEKDETDTELAVNVALSMKVKQIVIYGGFGSRFDHSFANIQLMWKCSKADVDCIVIDPYNRIRLVDKEVSLVKEYKFVSLIPFTPIVKGVTLTGFKYPLLNAVLQWGSSLGVSNEIVASLGTIKCTTGTLIVVESND